MRTNLGSLPMLVVIMWLASVESSMAQDSCGKRADIIEMLLNKYQEELRAMAISDQTLLLEVFTSKNGSWTILFTKPDGASCIVGAGDSWEEMPVKKNLTAL